MTHDWQRLQFALLIAVAGVLWLAAPGAAAAQPSRTPIPPLAAWDVAADGSIYVVDARQLVYELDPLTLAPIAVSDGWAPSSSAGAAQLVADTDRLYLYGEQPAEIRVLNRDTLDVVARVPLDAVALALEPGKRLFVIERRPAPAMPGLYTFDVVSLPLDHLGAPPQPFGPTAAQPFGSLFDLVVDSSQGLLYVGYLDTGSSPNRHYRTYRAYELESGTEIEMGIPHQPASTALRPDLTESGAAAISYLWEGVYPQQQRIYVVARDEEAQTIEGLSGPLALDDQGQWLYLVRERSLWTLKAEPQSGFILYSVLPFLQQPPQAVRLSPDGQTLYLFGNGWLTALDTASLQAGGVEPVHSFPTVWTSQATQDAQAPRLFTTAGGGDVALLNLQDSNEWYRSHDRGKSWSLLPNVQYPQDMGLDRLSLSPKMADDEIATGRGGWQEGQRTIWRSQDAGLSWERWTPPIAFVAGNEGARTLHIVETPGAEPRPVPVGGSTENPSWSPGWTHLTFQNNIAGDWEIYRVPATCSPAAEGPSSAARECDVQRLTDSAGDDLLPAWSPDGRMIAFVSLRDSNAEIYVMLADGSQPTRLTFAPGGDWRPAWLPDSRHLAFASDRNGSNDIFLMEVPQLLDGDNMREPPVTAVVASPADERDPAVSGDNELLYLSDRDGVMQPTSADLASFLASSNHTPLTGAPALQDVVEPIGHPGWLPGGDLLFASGGGIYTAARYAGPDEWNEITAPEDAALHPAAGPTWYWPQPAPGPIRLN